MPVLGKEAALEKFGGRVRRAFTHKAMNRLIQGSAADMTKMAMRDLYAEGYLPMHQMHDELDFSFECDEDAKRPVEIMENCVALQVPSVVDADFGNTWAEAM